MACSPLWPLPLRRRGDRGLDDEDALELMDSRRSSVGSVSRSTAGGGSTSSSGGRGLKAILFGTAEIKGKPRKI